MPRKLVFVFIISVLSVVGAIVVGQTPVPSPSVKPATVFSGEDVGIRVTDPLLHNGKIRGKLVVRVNGQWIEVVSPHGVVPLRE